MRKGVSIIETILVVGLLAILGTAGLMSLVGRRSSTELTMNVQRMASVLRDAQSRSVAQASSKSWGVHFDNGSTPYYSIFSGATYSLSAEEGRYGLPSTLRFTTSTVPQNGSVNIFFSQLTGFATGSSSVGIYMVRDQNSSSSVVIDPSGAISY